MSMTSGFMRGMLVPATRSAYPKKRDPAVAERLQNQRYRGGGQAGGKSAGDDRFHAEPDHFRATLGAHGAEAADHDAETAEIGEAAQRVGHQQPAARRKRRLAREI